MSKRADKRINFKPPLTAVIKTGDRYAEAFLIDISGSGLRFHSKEQYRKHEKLLIELQCDDDTELPRKIKAKVRNEYGKTENSLNIYGVKFLRISCWYEKNCIHNYVYSSLKETDPV